MAFNFSEFARNEAFQAQINDIMSIMEDQADPAILARFANLRRKHKIETEEDPPPDFHFM
jgi:formate dehydrogenase maturation protein FdhE